MKASELVAQQRAKNLLKWGEQNWPDGTSANMLTRERERAAKRIVEDRAKSGLLTYLAILDEEVCEAAAQTDEDKLIAELVDVASVAMDWIETIQRRQAARANACREIIEANADA